MDALAEQEAFLADVFAMVPGCNIKTETRFGRIKVHSRFAAFQHPSPAVVAADHILSETLTMLRSAEERWAGGGQRGVASQSHARVLAAGSLIKPFTRGVFEACRNMTGVA
eukprot:13254212-Alexandrium_andersonii.AAC.1